MVMSSLQNNTILIVDDEFEIRETLSEALTMCGFEVETASNGEEALTLLKRAVKPALILLDLMMPIMDGREFINAKEKNPELSEIPVVVISADGRLEAKLAGLKTDGHLKKPINLDKLLETAERHCWKHLKKSTSFS